MTLNRRTRKPKTCIANSFNVADSARKFAPGRWSFLGLGSEKKWNGIHVNKPDGEWRKLLKAWCSSLPKADILYFVPAAPWKEETWKAKETEWNPFTSTVVMKPLNWFFAQFFPSNCSVSDGAVADLCKELARDSDVRPEQRNFWGRSPSGKINAETSWKVFAVNYLVTTGILPIVIFLQGRIGM